MYSYWLQSQNSESQTKPSVVSLGMTGRFLRAVATVTGAAMVWLTVSPALAAMTKTIVMTKKEKRVSLETGCVSEIVGLSLNDIDILPYGQIIEKVDSLSERGRSELMACCETIDADEISKNLELRLPVVRIVAALLPLSFPLITRWLQNRRLREIHFTVFCYIDWAGELPEGDASRSEALRLVERYLLETDSKAAHAAWMAGDLLGDHWPITESLPVLIRILQQGRYVAGRKAALYGVETMLGNPDLAPNDRKRLIASLKVVRSHDRSVELQSFARRILGRMKSFAGKRSDMQLSDTLVSSTVPDSIVTD